VTMKDDRDIWTALDRRLTAIGGLVAEPPSRRPRRRAAQPASLAFVVLAVVIIGTIAALSRSGLPAANGGGAASGTPSPDSAILDADIPMPPGTVAEELAGTTAPSLLPDSVIEIARRDVPWAVGKSPSARFLLVASTDRHTSRPTGPLWVVYSDDVPSARFGGEVIPQPAGSAVRVSPGSATGSRSWVWMTADGEVLGVTSN
jgi:hypothetical protein